MATGYQHLIEQRNQIVLQIRKQQTVVVRSFVALNKDCLPAVIAKLYQRLETELQKPIRNNELIDDYIDEIMYELGE